jgi:ATP-binding cassette subfamily F protein 3
MRQSEIRSYLARYLFTGEHVFKKVETLSGGERGRLALAKLSLTRANLLLLDEPTNHLDIPSQEILQEVLARYQGTILLVSHDRYLIDALGSQIWEIDQEKRSLEVFEGGYTAYREYQERVAEQAASETSTRRTKTKKQSNTKARNERRRRARLKDIEEQISVLEDQLSSLSQKLENPPKDPAKVQELGHDFVRVQSELEMLLGEWETLHE